MYVSQSKRARIASEPIIDIQDRPLMYIDTASRSGMSGSPVIIYIRKEEVSQFVIHIRQKLQKLVTFSWNLLEYTLGA